MKKLFAALVAVLCLAGCGAKEQPQPVEAEPIPTVEEPAPVEPAPETPEVVEIPMEVHPGEIPAQNITMPDYETVQLEGLVEDAIGYVIAYPVFSGFDGAETVNGYYLNLAEHLERYTKETVYKDIMEKQLVASVYGEVTSVQTDGEKLQVDYVFRVETEDNVDESTRTDIFDMTTGEREE